MPQKISNPSGKILPTLYCLTKKGQFQSWTVIASGYRVITRFGLQHGKVQESSKECEPTNVGRSNERTAEQQAIFEADAMWKKQIRLGYRESTTDAAQVTFGPMLAQKFDGREDKIQYPVDVQPKLDGIRCLAYMEDGKLRLMSRGNKDFDLPHITKALTNLFASADDLVLDGELYTPGISMQTIASWVKRKGHPEQSKIQYHVYDIPSDQPWRIRRRELDALINDNKGPVKKVSYRSVDSADEVWTYQRACVGLGYEGAMVRCLETPYEFANRSYGLLKVKRFSDSEFKIVGVTEGRGKMAGCAIFECITDRKQSFNCVMRGTMEQRNAHYADRHSLIGKTMTIRYFDTTDEGIPRFPVGLCVRDYE